MTLRRIEIDDFRCLAEVRLDLDPRYNLFVGPNASGKTSLLEALFFLGRGRSFRTRRLDRLVRQGREGFRVVGWTEAAGHTTVLGIGGDRRSTEIRIGGAAAGSAGELAHHFPPQVIDPEVHKLLEEGPHRRRRFLDWGVFHVEPTFLETWQRYHRALRQRNAGLKPGADPESARAWDPEILAAGTRLDEIRRSYLALLEPTLQAFGARLLGLPVALSYASGWAAGETLAEALERSSDRDRKLGVTHVGPHRADVTARVDGQVARERVSRGQQKLLAAALTLAQLAVQETRAPGTGALLLDDPAAELDAANLERLLDLVRELRVQLFVTALRPDLAGLGLPGAVFHVEHGRISRQG
ncbi:MAG: DNA replication/repair protein RecF [Proteobacteria bacterium]|nr:DNA replication/repair protein RecF [Pseudomonadota bacterium]